MASARKRGNTWTLYYRDATGRQRTEGGFRTKSLALARGADVEVSMRTGRYVDPRHARGTFGDWFDRWTQARRVSATRAAAEASLAANHVLPRWSEVRLGAIAHMDVQAWVTDLSGSLSAATVADVYALLRQPLDAAVREGVVAVNPAIGVRLLPRTRRKPNASDVLTIGELLSLTEAVPPRWRALVLSTGVVGWRWSEAMGLRRRDINMLRREVTLGTVVVVEVAGKTIEKQGGKTAAAARTVPLPRTVAAAIGDHIAEFCPDAGPDDFIFRTEAGTAPLRSNFARQVLKPALRRCGLDDRPITMRQLRHVAASIMLEEGLALQDVQERLGHSRPSVTYDVYAALIPGRREAGTQALDAALLRTGQQ